MNEDDRPVQWMLWTAGRPLWSGPAFGRADALARARFDLGELPATVEVVPIQDGHRWTPTVALAAAMFDGAVKCWAHGGTRRGGLFAPAAGWEPSAAVIVACNEGDLSLPIPAELVRGGDFAAVERHALGAADRLGGVAEFVAGIHRRGDEAHLMVIGLGDMSDASAREVAEAAAAGWMRWVFPPAFERFRHPGRIWHRPADDNAQAVAALWQQTTGRPAAALTAWAHLGIYDPRAIAATDAPDPDAPAAVWRIVGHAGELEGDGVPDRIADPSRIAVAIARKLREHVEDGDPEAAERLRRALRGQRVAAVVTYRPASGDGVWFELADGRLLDAWGNEVATKEDQT